MANLPVLEQGGTVVYETTEDLDLSVERFLSKGALAVTPRRALAPLEQLEIVVSAAFLVERPRLTVEVVHLDAQRAVLRLLVPFDVARLRARTAPAPPSDAATTTAQATTAATGSPPRSTSSSVSSSSVSSSAASPSTRSSPAPSS